MKKDNQFEQSFIEAFGQQDPNGQYLPRDPRDIVRDYERNNRNEMANESQNQSGDEVEQDTQYGFSKQTGERFEVDVKTIKEKVPKDPQEKEWVKREMMVTFTSLDDHSKMICSTLSGLCGGRYSDLSYLSVGEVAEHLTKEYDQIFTHADTSLAKYAEVIDSKQAFRVVRSISENNIISHGDYEKLKLKLTPHFESEFDNLLAEAKIKVAYPIQQSDPSDFYINYVQDLKEYRLKDMPSLRPRIASMLSAMEDNEKERILAKFKQDEFLKNF
jgi:hypothetical protein